MNIIFPHWVKNIHLIFTSVVRTEEHVVSYSDPDKTTNGGLQLKTKNNENLSPSAQSSSIVGPLLENNVVATLETIKPTKCVVCFDHTSMISIEVLLVYGLPSSIA